MRTTETIAIARVLEGDPALRTAIMTAIADMDGPVLYANQDIDRRAYLADLLGEAARKQGGK